MQRSYFLCIIYSSPKSCRIFFSMQWQIWNTPYEILVIKPRGSQDHIDIATVLGFS